MQVENPLVVALGVLPGLVFWALDAYYLRQERLYRSLWDDVAKSQSDATQDFSMDTDPYKGERTFKAALRSPVVWLVHGSGIAAMVIITAILAFAVSE